MLKGVTWTFNVMLPRAYSGFGNSPYPNVRLGRSGKLSDDGFGAASCRHPRPASHTGEVTVLGEPLERLRQ